MTRYFRQIILSEIGDAGQKKLAGSSVLIVGAGGLGSPAALYLAAAGIGKITIADADDVRLNNLNRQILYTEKDVGRSKSRTAVERLRTLNSEISFDFLERIDGQNIEKILTAGEFSAIVDGTDNFETRYLLNDACVDKNIPLVHGSVLGFGGQVSVFDTRHGPCYRCVYPEPPKDAKTCVEAGVMGATTGLIGTLQAAEVIKLITGAGDALIGKMLVVDLLENTYKMIEVCRDPHCPTCS